MKKNIIIHVPHSSLKIPKVFWDFCVLDKQTIREENFFLCDNYIDDFVPKGYRKLVFKYSRLFCDVERFSDDKLESMAKKGMGVVYTKTSNNMTFFKPNENYKKFVINKYYKKHHNKFNKLCYEIVKKYKTCLVVDLHSFSDELIYRVLNLDNNPDICIGFDDDFSDENIIEFTVNFFEQFGYLVKCNYPYSGSIVPSEFYFSKSDKVKSIMIEINKRVYMDNELINKIKYKRLKRIIKKYFDELSRKIK